MLSNSNYLWTGLGSGHGLYLLRRYFNVTECPSQSMIRTSSRPRMALGGKAPVGAFSLYCPPGVILQEHQFPKLKYTAFSLFFFFMGNYLLG